MRTATELPPWLWRALLAVTLGLFLVAAGSDVRSPGLYYDEVVFVNAATGAESPSFVYLQVQGVPIMLMPYLGALKAWIHWPIFTLLGTSAFTIRWPSILISAGTLWLGFATVRLWLGTTPALAFAALCAASPAFIVQSRLDWGPVVLMLLIKAAVFYALSRAILERRQMFLWTAAALCVVGLWDKLNFIWFIAAVAVALPVAFWTSLRTAVEPRWALPVIGLGGCTAVVVGLLVIPLIDVPEVSAVVARVPISWAALVTTFDGSGTDLLVFGAGVLPLRVHWFWLFVGLLFASPVVLMVARRLHGSEFHRMPDVQLLVFSLVIGFLIFAQIVVTPQAGGPHHFAMLFPYPQLAFVALGCVGLGVSGRARPVLAPLLLAAALVVIAAEGTAVAGFHRALRQSPGPLPRWSERVYDLPSYLSTLQPAPSRIVFTDWGLHNQVYALGDASLRERLLDSWPHFMDAQKTRLAAAAPAQARPSMTMAFVAFTAGREVFPQTRVHLRSWLRTQPDGWDMRTVPGMDGEPLYEIYLVTAPATQMLRQ